MNRIRRTLVSLTTALCLWALSGCMQVETHVKLHKDGSATITERMRFSSRLLDLERTEKADAMISRLLAKEYATQRAGMMGKGTTLVSQKITPSENGSKESIAVYKIPNLNNFQFVSPYLSTREYANHSIIKCKMFPIYQTTWYGRLAGQMGVQFYTGSKVPRPPKDYKPKVPSPQELQVFRELQPIFEDMLKDFSVKLTFESYAAVRFRQYYRYRGQAARTKRYDLIDFSDKSLDNYGTSFLGNEEIMLELLRGHFGGGNVSRHTRNHATNLTLPVYHGSNTPEIYFNPSKIHFDKLFEGKILEYSRDTRKQSIKKPAKFRPLPD